MIRYINRKFLEKKENVKKEIVHLPIYNIAN